MYLDTDVILALLKTDDWLASEVDLESIQGPVTSVATCIEVQYVMETEWSRDRLSSVYEEITETGIELVPLLVDHLAAGGKLRRSYNRLNFFDAIHLGTVLELGDMIVSTDTLYPDIQEIESIDPRDMTS